MENEEFYTETW